MIEQLVNKVPYVEHFGITSDDNWDDIYEQAHLHDFVDTIDNAAATMGMSIEYATGSSKLVIISTDDDYVMKIPYNGFYEDTYGYAYDSECEERWSPFKRSTDYCALESFIYQKAKEFEVEMFFAEVKECGKNANNMSIYLQEKAYSLESEYSPLQSFSFKSATSQKTLDFIENINGSEDYVPWDDEWMIAATDYYGEDAVNRFLEFTNRYSRIIKNDMHSGNYGFRLDGTPCLIDYSGFEG